MKRELLQKLLERFPYIQNEENIGLQWGCGVDCGDGWFDLLYTLLEKIENIYSANNKSIDDFIISQIKEKYGELRFYASSDIPEVNKLIDEYEELSATICEDCGKSGSLHTNSNGYMLTLCEECAVKEGFTKL